MTKKTQSEGKTLEEANNINKRYERSWKEFKGRLKIFPDN